jgi:hypothetical protein
MFTYALCVCLIAFVRGDMATIATTVLFCSAVIVVFALELTPSTDLLNSLFLLSIVVNGVLFLIGMSIYAIIPGYSKDGELWWRVSLFPQVATSAYFCLVIFFVNVADRGARLRRLCIVLSTYFLLFSGIRSALIAAFLAGGYVMLVRTGRLRRAGARILYLASTVVVFVTSLFMTQLLLLVPAFGNPTLNMYLFRTSGGFESEAEAAKAIFRTWLWSEHLRIAAQNPLFGIGTFDFFAVSSFDPMFADMSSGSEAYLTGLLARVGLPVILFVAAFVAAIMRGIRVDDETVPVVGLFLFLAMLAYGSFINAYDFVFLVMIGLLSAPRMRSKRSLPGSLRRAES